MLARQEILVLAEDKNLGRFKPRRGPVIFP